MSECKHCEQYLSQSVELTLENIRYQQRANVAESDLTRQEGQLEALQCDNATKDEQIKSFHKAVNTLDADIAQLEVKVVSHEGNIKMRAEHVERLQVQLKQQKDLHIGLSQAYESRGGELNRSQMQCMELNQQLSRFSQPKKPEQKDPEHKEFCEWKFFKPGIKGFCVTDCGERVILQHHFKFCPFCGLEIREVE